MAVNTRTLGNTGVALTTVGLGTWAHGGGDWAFSWGPQDDETSIRTVLAALDAGINWVDCAAVYGLGHAEEVLGRALKDVTKRPFVATKCGLVWDDQGRVSNRLTRDSVRRECEDSLRRLGIDTIDLYQIHWPNPDPQIEEGWTAIAELAAEGKVRYAGVSNFPVEAMRRCLPIHPIASLQPPYSMLRRDIEAEHIDFCREHGIGIIAYSPMEKGLLTGKITAERVQGLPPDDHRRRDPKFREPQLFAILRRVEHLRPIAERHGTTLAQLAVAWVCLRPEVTAAIVGARSPEQIRDTAQAMQLSLSADDAAEIAAILDESD
jgi:aryl-alcohol dehydrogenase-like predicted oxidoreductase